MLRFCLDKVDMSFGLDEDPSDNQDRWTIEVTSANITAKNTLNFKQGTLKTVNISL